VHVKQIGCNSILIVLKHQTTQEIDKTWAKMKETQESPTFKDTGFENIFQSERNNCKKD
jgi:hypothetical protein